MQDKITLDKFGRLLIPIELRDELGFNYSVEIQIMNGKVIMIEAVGTTLRAVNLIDNLGRITLPIHIRQVLGYQEGDKLDLKIEKVLSIAKI